MFWKTLTVRAAVFLGFAITTFLVLYGSYLTLKPARLGELTGVPILINGQPIQLPVEPVLRLIALGGSLAIAVITGAGIMANWRTLALYWYGRSGSTAEAPLTRSDLRAAARLLSVHPSGVGDCRSDGY